MADAKDNPLTGLAKSEAADRLKAEAQAFMLAQLERALVGVGHKLGSATVKLNDIAEGKSPGFAQLALKGGRKLAEGKGPVRSAVELTGSHLKDRLMGAVKGLGGKRKKGGAGQKPTVILEYVDVGVPVRTAYDQWTQYQEFSTFAKGVKGATVADDTQSDWNLKVFWSSRSWKAHTTEQIPDQRITWTSEGAKGTTKGVVTFHPLGENLTRILLIIEYYPKGLFEKTGNIWRAQGRRARLDLKHFARHISLKGEASDGWRGEIRDGEVVVSHEDALAEEERAEGEEGESAELEEAKGEQDEYGEEYEDESEEPEEDDENAYDDHGEEDDDEVAYEDDREARDDRDDEDTEPEGEYDEEAEGAYEDEPEDEEYEEESRDDYAGTGRR
ncbi:SRPBCC family protein [Streptomyces indicus]|uniref:Polyketide cyclase / dehydrase and lipid transport n=1 Tax=Streptomyces indicus TaxID=417292 RepID=A0A1G8UL42_9ACTN|nr:SRPBCC family protein [Streptomyces indicus]SDJ53710.1 Polyketide cyclase / dehydrase and lipid transport [Streptomyces indicus]